MVVKESAPKARQIAQYDNSGNLLGVSVLFNWEKGVATEFGDDGKYAERPITEEEKQQKELRTAPQPSVTDRLKANLGVFTTRKDTEKKGEKSEESRPATPEEVKQREEKLTELDTYAKGAQARQDEQKINKGKKYLDARQTLGDSKSALIAGLLGAVADGNQELVVEVVKGFGTLEAKDREAVMALLVHAGLSMEDRFKVRAAFLELDRAAGVRKPAEKEVTKEKAPNYSKIKVEKLEVLGNGVGTDAVTRIRATLGKMPKGTYHLKGEIKVKTKDKPDSVVTIAIDRDEVVPGEKGFIAEKLPRLNAAEVSEVVLDLEVARDGKRVKSLSARYSPDSDLASGAPAIIETKKKRTTRTTKKKKGAETGKGETDTIKETNKLDLRGIVNVAERKDNKGAIVELKIGGLPKDNYNLRGQGTIQYEAKPTKLAKKENGNSKHMEMSFEIDRFGVTTEADGETWVRVTVMPDVKPEDIRSIAAQVEVFAHGKTVGEVSFTYPNGQAETVIADAKEPETEQPT